jgi:hypothetical protein
VKLSAAMIACSLMLALGFWYAYWASAGEAPTSEETTLLAGVAAALVVGTTMIWSRFRRPRESKRE